MSLFALDPGPQSSMDTLFFAIRPPASLASEIARLAERSKGLFNLKGAPIPAERLHVTMAYIGLHAADLVAVAERAAAGLAAKPIDVTFDRMVSFKGKPGNHPLVLQGGPALNGLRFLQRQLALEIKRVGIPSAAKAGFEPHITLLYDRAVVPETPVDPITWTVRELVLVQSLVGQGRHIDLKAWPLL
ncbi:MAG: 2'-5' RNA ligase family protein [Micropepsaceae bacterium]